MLNQWSMFISGGHSLTKTLDSGLRARVSRCECDWASVTTLWCFTPPGAPQWPHTESTGVTSNTQHAGDDRTKTRHWQVTADSSLSSHNISVLQCRQFSIWFSQKEWDLDFDNSIFSYWGKERLNIKCRLEIKLLKAQNIYECSFYDSAFYVCLHWKFTVDLVLV